MSHKAEPVDGVGRIVCRLCGRPVVDSPRGFEHKRGPSPAGKYVVAGVAFAIPIIPRCPDCEARCQLTASLIWRCPWSTSQRGAAVRTESSVLIRCDWPYSNPDRRRAA